MPLLGNKNSSLPKIKGMFVNSHVKALRAAKGEDALRELARRYGTPIDFKDFEDVPVREEVKIIEHTLDLLSETSVPPDQRAFEAGRLHLRNFTTTPYGQILFSALPKGPASFKRIMLGSRFIAKYVFRNVTYLTEDIGPEKVKVMMGNMDYPLDHFKGFFYELMLFFGLENSKIEASEIAPGKCEYVMSYS